MAEKIIFTTAYEQKRYDYIGSNSAFSLNLRSPRIMSYGLRFIKQNIPEIGILEYPAWEEYKKFIKENHIDILGFSFYLADSDRILRMIKYAREHGVKEIWGGNYGILDKNIQKYFDRIFTTYSENEIGAILGEKIRPLIHPPLMGYLSAPLGFKLSRHGVLFTSRGCSFKCSFCQTQAFCADPIKIPIESIEEVLKY
jgi:hypothetical protein